MSQHSNEHTHLLQNHQEEPGQSDEDDEVVNFGEKDQEDPRQWPLHRKYVHVLLVFLIGLVGPMASSIFAPAINEIAVDFETDQQIVLLGQSGFVCMLGIGPLLLGPMSEVFGRRKIFLLNLTVFTILQVPVSLAPDVGTFIALRTVGGFFGSVGVANGGGLISDLFETSERAVVLGFYLMAPLLAPPLGALLGGLTVVSLGWRWIFWIELILAAIVTVACYFLLSETRAVVILQSRKSKLQKENPDKNYSVKGDSNESVMSKIASNSTKACKLLLYQPIVLTMSAYQALVFSSMYSLYSQYSAIWSSEPYKFTTTQVSMAYLAPAAGFILVALIVVPFIDKMYKSLSDSLNEGKGKPEYRLPLANIGAVLLPISLFWFGWTVEKQMDWPIPLAATLLFGGSQVSIFNTVQNYYIDAFEDMAASALAAGAFLRSILGGVVPLLVSHMFTKIGYGWGMSVFGFISVAMMPAPLLFFWYGEELREKFNPDV